MKKPAFIGLGILAALAIVGALTPGFREKVQHYLHVPGREVLATAEGDLLNDGSIVKAVKYKGDDRIFVEVLKTGPDSSYSLIERIDLPDRHDGLFNFHGHVTRLAITDIDGNGSMELLAPTFDAQLVPHLNIFRFNAALKRFELALPPQKP